MNSAHEKLTRSDVPCPASRCGERGYALIALLAMMSIMALILITAVPNVRKQAQRSLEEEAIWRGEQVVDAADEALA